MVVVNNGIHVTDDFFSFSENDVISGNVLINDAAGLNGQKYLRSFDGDSVLAKKAGQITDVKGDFGTFHIKADGSFTYDMDDAVKAGLDTNETVQERVLYKISDGSGHTDVGYLTLDVHGVTDVPPPPQKVGLTLDFEDITTSDQGEFGDTYHGFNFRMDGGTTPYDTVALSTHSFDSLAGITMNGSAGNYVGAANLDTDFNFDRVDGSEFDFLGANISILSQYVGDVRIVAYDKGKVIVDHTVHVDGSYLTLNILHTDHVSLIDPGHIIAVDNMNFNVTPLV